MGVDKELQLPWSPGTLRSNSRPSVSPKIIASLSAFKKSAQFKNSFLTLNVPILDKVKKFNSILISIQLSEINRSLMVKVKADFRF